MTITGCTATANAHSLVQVAGIDGILIENSTIKSVRGMNFNSSTNVTVDNCSVDVQNMPFVSVQVRVAQEKLRYILLRIAH